MSSEKKADLIFAFVGPSSVSTVISFEAEFSDAVNFSIEALEDWKPKIEIKKRFFFFFFKSTHVLFSNETLWTCKIVWDVLLWINHWPTVKIQQSIKLQ